MAVVVLFLYLVVAPIMMVCLVLIGAPLLMLVGSLLRAMMRECGCCLVVNGFVFPCCSLLYSLVWLRVLRVNLVVLVTTHDWDGWAYGGFIALASRVWLAYRVLG